MPKAHEWGFHLPQRSITFTQSKFLSYFVLLKQQQSQMSKKLQTNICSRVTYQNHKDLRALRNNFSLGIYPLHKNLFDINGTNTSGLENQYPRLYQQKTKSIIENYLHPCEGIDPMLPRYRHN